MEYSAARCKELEKENAFLKEEIALLREQIKLLKHKIFGRSADVVPEDSEQLSLFPDETPEDNSVEPEPEKEEITYSRKKPGRKGLNPDLPVTEIILDVPLEQRMCDCGAEKDCIGREVSHKVEYQPAKVEVIRTVRLKYACDTCEGVDDEGPTVVIAPVPPALIPKAIVTPSLMAHILTAKFVDALPFYRQEKQFKRLGLDLGRGSMASWTINIAEQCEALVKLLEIEVKKRPALQLDETTIQVMNEKDKKNTTKSYIWVLRAGPPKIGPPENLINFPNEPEIVIYWYQPTRSSKVVHEILDGYKGYVQTDEYAGYAYLDAKSSEVLGIIHVLCLAHMRRKFTEALSAGSHKIKSGKQNFALDIIKDIKVIYRTHRRLQHSAATTSDLINLRKTELSPLLDDLNKKINDLDGKVTPKSKLGKAIGYAIRVLPKVSKFVDCPNLTLDNNDTESKIRPLAVGRKNWLMANTPDGADALALWYTLIGTAMANGWEPNEYLLHLLEGIRIGSPIRNLMPTLSPVTC